MVEVYFYNTTSIDLMANFCSIISRKLLGTYILNLMVCPKIANARLLLRVEMMPSSPLQSLGAPCEQGTLLSLSVLLTNKAFLTKAAASFAFFL